MKFFANGWLQNLQDSAFLYIVQKYKDFSNPVIRAYMKYFATKNADTHETQTINDQVSFYKDDTLIRSKYMTYEFDLHESKEEGEQKPSSKWSMECSLMGN